MKTLTAAQLENLKTITKQVKGDYQQLDITDVLNRIHLITNRGYDKCIEGLKLMLHHQLLMTAFVLRLDQLGRYERATNKALPIIEALDAQQIKPGTFESLGTVKLLDGPTDDPDEADGWQEVDADISKWQANGSPSRHIDLSHINSDF